MLVIGYKQAKQTISEEIINENNLTMTCSGIDNLYEYVEPGTHVLANWHLECLTRQKYKTAREPYKFILDNKALIECK